MIDKPKIDNRYKLLGLLGNPVAHSFSPAMHNAALEEMGLKYVYLAFNIDEHFLKGAVDGLKALGARGFNVTIPFKETILPFLDDIDISAQMVGAVNTVLIDNAKAYGFNTDVSGFARLIVDKGLNLNGGSALILGAGGAAKAVVAALINLGAKNIYIYNRNRDKARALVENYKENTNCLLLDIAKEEIADVISKSILLVNATSIGMHGYMENQSPIEVKLLRKNLWVCDLVYNPTKTVLLHSAEKAGCQTINGLGMLVHQGADALKIWTGMEPPRIVMEQQLKEKIR